MIRFEMFKKCHQTQTCILGFLVSHRAVAARVMNLSSVASF